MDRANLPFSASVLNALQSAHPAGISLPNTLPRLVATPFRSSSGKIFPTVGVDMIAGIEGRRITRLMADLNKNHGWWISVRWEE